MLRHALLVKWRAVHALGASRTFGTERRIFFAEPRFTRQRHGPSRISGRAHPRNLTRLLARAAPLGAVWLGVAFAGRLTVANLMGRPQSDVDDAVVLSA
jgi:hypothetical protein